MPPSDSAPFELPLHDLVPADQFAPQSHTPLWQWFAIAAATALLTVLLWLLYRHLRSNQQSGQTENTAYEIAKDRLDQLKSSAKADQLPPSVLASRISLVLRAYLEQTAGDPSLFQTHEEFLLSKEALATLPESGRKTTESFFSKLADQKYAPSQAATSTQSVLCDDASDLLRQLHHSQSSASLPAA